MHGKHEHADNLFLRLSSYSPRPKRDCLEDFCSEALVWCLRCSTHFRRQFFERTGFPFLREGAIIHTQQKYKGEPDDESSKAGRFDIVLESEDSADESSFYVAIECKVGSPFGKRQIADYLKHLQSIKDQNRYDYVKLITLTNVRDAPMLGVKHLFWGQVYDALMDAYREASSEPLYEQEVKMILRQYAEFLELKKLGNMKIQKTNPVILSEFTRSAILRQNMDNILLSLKETKGLKPLLTKKFPKLDGEREDDVYLAFNVKEPYIYIGFHIWSSGSSSQFDMYIESSRRGDKRKLVEQLQSPVRTTRALNDFEDGGTWFTFEQKVDDQYDGDAEAMLAWFRVHALMALNLGKKRSKVHLDD